MKHLFTPVLAAFLLGRMLFTNQTSAQNPCGFDITAVVIPQSCDKSCNASISVTPNQPWVFEFLWSNGSTSNEITDLCADDYSVIVTDDKKCSQTYNFTIVDPAPVTVSCTKLVDESYCGANDGSIEAAASGGDGNFVYEWQTNPIVSGALLSGIPAGTYTVIVYDGNDCTATTTCSITCEKKEECLGFRTQTQGGWGQCQQNGNNPGTYLF